MIGYTFENLSLPKQDKVVKWLTKTFGESTPETWCFERDYDLVNLLVSEEINTFYVLKWK